MILITDTSDPQFELPPSHLLPLKSLSAGRSLSPMPDQFSKKGVSKLRSITQHSVSEKLTKSKPTANSDVKKSKIGRVKSLSEKVEKNILDIDVDLLAEKLPRIRRDSVPPEKIGEDLYKDDFDEENGIFENTELDEVVSSEIDFIVPPLQADKKENKIEIIEKETENVVVEKENKIKSPAKENKVETVKMEVEIESKTLKKESEIESPEKESVIEIVEKETETANETANETENETENETADEDDAEDKADTESETDGQENEIEFVPKLGKITRRKSYTEQLAESSLDGSSVVECPLVEGLGQEDAFKPRRASILVK